MKTPIAALMLVLIVGMAAAMGVAPTVDSAVVVQGGKTANNYEAWELAGETTIGTSVSWAIPSATRKMPTNGEMQFSVSFEPTKTVAPGNYTIVTTVSSGDEITTIETAVEVREYLWVYDYLRAGETYDDVSVLEFVYNGETYEVAKIKGKETLIAKGDVVLADESMIRAVADAYYRANDYPSDLELTQLWSLITTFNNSRNAMTQFGAAERVCKIFTGLGVLPCYDFTSCKLACRASHAEDMGACEDQGLVNEIMAFSLGTKNMDNNMSACGYLISNMTPESAVDNLQKIKKDLEDTKTTAQALLGSKLRYEQSCMSCYAMCPVMPYNMTAIGNAISKAGELYQRAAGAGAENDFIDGIITGCISRADYAQDMAKKRVFEDRYAKIREKELYMKSRIENITSLVQASELSIKLNSLVALSEEINAKIENDTYDDAAALEAELNTLFTRFERMYSEDAAMLAGVSAPYDEMLAKREEARNLMMRAQLNTVQGDSGSAKLSEITARYDEAENVRANPVTESEIASLKADYEGMASEAAGILSSKPGDTVTEAAAEFFSDFSLSVGYALMGLAGKTSYADRIGAAPMITSAAIGLAALLAIVLVAGALMVFVLRHRRNPRAVKRKLVVLGLFCAFVVFASLMAAITMYYLVDQSSGPRIWNSFADELAGAGRASVFMDTGSAINAPEAAMVQEAVVSCGSKITEAMAGRQVTEYTIVGGECMKGNETLTKAQCMDEAWGAPYVYVSYSDSGKMEFRTLYETSATVSGNYDDLGRCLLADVITGG